MDEFDIEFQSISALPCNRVNTFSADSPRMQER